MTAPWVGPPTDGKGCAFSVDLASPACAQQPTLHIQVRSEAWGEVGLTTCDEHAGIARSTGAWIAEHAYGPRCPESTICWLGRSGS